MLDRFALGPSHPLRMTRGIWGGVGVLAADADVALRAMGKRPAVDIALRAMGRTRGPPLRVAHEGMSRDQGSLRVQAMRSQ